MKIIESFLCGKENNPETCEDGLIIGPHLVAIIDGVTSKGSHLWHGKSSGRYARDLLINYLQRDVELQTAVQLLENLDRILHESIKAATLPSVEYPRAAIILYNDVYREIWSYGDCQCRINEAVYTHTKAIDELNADLRALYLEYYLTQGMSIEELQKNDLGRKAIQQNLIMQFSFENKPGQLGYPILNGQGIEKSMIKRYPVSEGDVIVLASDGYPVLKESLVECEIELDKIRESDPMCFRMYHATKGIKRENVSFDDRAFCKFEV